MVIPKYINTRTFFIKNKNFTVSLVEDLKNHVFYILKNELSDKWKEIVSNNNFKTKDTEKFFLGLNKNSNACIIINTGCENYEYFESKLGQFFIENGISFLYLELNYRCNQRCKHCYNPKNMNEYAIDFKQAKKIIDDAYSCKIYGIGLTGGECTINKDFLKIAKYIRKKRMDLAIQTNGQELYDNEKLFNNLINIYPASFKISLYSMNPEEHDFITGVKGSYYKTLCIIKRLREKNIRVDIACPQLAYNIGSYKEVKKFAKEVGATFLTTCTFIYNKNNDNLNAKLSNKDIVKFYYDTFNPDKIRDKFRKSNERICGIGHICIKPNLDITPCVGFNYILGNYNSTPLTKLQNNILPEFRKGYIKTNLKECFKHDYCKFCKYCSIYTTNDSGFLKKSPILCEDARAYQKVFLYYQKLHKNNIE